MDEWWEDLEREIVTCLQTAGAMAPAELGRRLGLPPGAAVSLLSILAREGKVRIVLVEPATTLRPAAPR